MLNDRRLPNDFAALVASKCADLPPELTAHPSDAQRVEAARSVDAPGVFGRKDWAYGHDLRLKVRDVRLLDTTETIQESRKATDAILALNQLFKGGVSVLRPIVVDSDAIGLAVSPVGAWESLQTARLAMRETASTGEAARRRYAELEDQKTQAMAARQLIQAGYGLGAEDFCLTEPTTTAADAMITRVSVEQDVVAHEMSPYEQYVGRRFTAACQILHGVRIDGPRATSSLRDHASTMIRMLTVLNGPYGIVLALHQRLIVFDRVLAYARIRQDFERLNPCVYGLEDVLRKLVAQVRDTVGDTRYPFGHGGGAMTLSRYLRGPDVPTEDVATVLLDARAHVDLFFELYWRVVGELAAIVEQVEGIPSGR